MLKRQTLPGIGTLVDVGGGHGLLLASILQVNPGMQGILLALPHAVEWATRLFQSAGLATRCTVIGGDFVETIPAGGDAYLRSARRSPHVRVST